MSRFPASRATERRTLLRAACGLIAGAGAPGRSTAQGASDVPTLVATAKPAVVAVGLYSRLSNPSFRFYGTGFFVERDRMVTCAHVLQPPDPQTREVLAAAFPAADGSARIVEMKVVATRRDADLAVLEPVAAPPTPLPALHLSNTLPPEGADILLMGFPMGGALGLRVATHRGVIATVVPMAIPLPTTRGLEARNVQALRSPPIELLQLDATAYPGNSGGPVLDVRTGLVVGVVSMTMVKGTRESALTAPSGISYAVPVQQLAGMLPAK